MGTTAGGVIGKAKSGIKSGKMAVLVAACAAAVFVGTVPVEADSGGTVGSITGTSCGWHSVNSYLPFEPYRVTTASLPSVTGTSTADQHVWAFVEFKNYANGTATTYRSGWFYTTARYGVWSSYWTAYSTGQTNVTAVDDAPNESGFVGNNPPIHVVSLLVFWQSPSNQNVNIGWVYQYEANPRWTIYPDIVCDAGGSYA